MQKLKFLKKIEFFLEKTGMSASSFGVKACSDPTFVFWLRRGRETREKMQNRILNFIKNYTCEVKEAQSIWNSSRNR